MKNRCYRSKPADIEMAILKLNLTHDSSFGSGSLDLLEEGCQIVGGYIVKHEKQVVGWLSAFDNKEIHIYVSKFARRQGIAYKMIKRSKKDFKNYFFCPWNRETSNLFKKYKAPCTNKYL